MPDRPRVLVVNENERVRGFLADAVAALGCPVDEAGDAVDALALLRGQAYELVVTDLRAPPMDAREFVECVRREMPAVRFVIIASGEDSDPDLERAVQAGVRLVMKAARDAETKEPAVEVRPPVRRPAAGSEACPVCGGSLSDGADRVYWSGLSRVHALCWRIGPKRVDA